MYIVREGILVHSLEAKVMLTFQATQTPLPPSKAYRSFLRIMPFKCIKSNSWMAENSSYIDSVRGPLDLGCWKNLKR